MRNRNDLSQMTAEERQIFDCIGAIGKLAADIRLTNCQIKLGQAKDHLSDFIDGVEPEPLATSPGPFGLLHMGRGTFGQAVETAKQGKKVARSGWNGKGMYLQLVQPIHKIQQHGTDMPCYRLTGTPQDKNALPWIGLKTADDMFTPWNPNNLDMLAEDWCII